MLFREYRLFRRMLKELRDAPLPLGETQRRGAEFRILHEPLGSYEARCGYAKVQGLPAPPREMAWEVSYWPIAGQPCLTQRGRTLAEALERAMAVPFPASLS
jgi:hypothetical protein